MFIKTEHGNYLNSKYIKYMCVAEHTNKYGIKAEIGHNAYKISRHETFEEAQEALDRLVKDLNS